MARDQQRPQAWPQPASAPDNLCAVGSWHSIVHYQKVYRDVAAQYSKRRFRATRLVHSIAIGREQLAEETPQVVIVVAEQDIARARRQVECRALGGDRRRRRLLGLW